jgi:hypothetical protein
MAVFFNGQLLVSPTTVSFVNDAALANQNLTVGNVVAIIGASTGGQPNTGLVFGDPNVAASVLQSGELLTAVQKCFAPSADTGGPTTVIAVRVNPAVQAALVLSDVSPTPVINLVSTDYGLYTNQIKVKIETGSTAGKKITTQLGNNFYVQDNIQRRTFQIQYTGGQATASMTINGTTLTVFAPNGTPIAVVDLATYPTVAQVVDRLNAVAGIVASILDGNNNAATLNALDYVTAVDIKTAPVTALANLQAIVDYFNGLAEGFVTATRVAAVGTLPVNIPFTFLAGGSDGTITNTQWANALTTLQSAATPAPGAVGIDPQWIVPISSDPAIAAMVDAHVQFMSTIGKKERRAICGTALGTTDAAAIAAAKAINSDRTSLVHLGYYDYNAAGALTLYSPYLTAAAVAGAFSGVGPGTPLTNKTLNLRGIERNLKNPIDTDPLILGGVFAIENTPNGYKVVKSISTWLVDTNFYRVEVSTGVAGDFVARNLRNALDPLRGSKSDPLLLSQAASRTASICTLLAVPEPNGPGVLVGNAANPPFKNITASIVGDVLSVSVQASLVIPNNYILITIAAVPFSGSVSA